jgi:hypothetical protein
MLEHVVTEDRVEGRGRPRQFTLDRAADNLVVALIREPDRTSDLEALISGMVGPWT